MNSGSASLQAHAHALADLVADVATAGVVGAAEVSANSETERSQNTVWVSLLGALRLVVEVQRLVVAALGLPLLDLAPA
jgi:hypothetical protein